MFNLILIAHILNKLFISSRLLSENTSSIKDAMLAFTGIFLIGQTENFVLSLYETVHFTLYLGVFFPTCSVSPDVNLHSITINLSLISSLLPLKYLELVQNLNIQFMLKH